MSYNKVLFPRACLTVSCQPGGLGPPEVKVFSSQPPRPLSFSRRITSGGLGLLFLLMNAGLKDQVLGGRASEHVSPGAWETGHKSLCPSFSKVYQPCRALCLCGSVFSGTGPLSCGLLPGGLGAPACQSSHLFLWLPLGRPCAGLHSAGLLQEGFTS